MRAVKIITRDCPEEERNKQEKVSLYRKYVKEVF